MPLPWLCRCLLWENALRIAIFTVCQLEQYVKSAKYQHNKYRKLLALLAKDQIVYASFLKATHLLAALPTVRLTRTRDEPDPPFSHMFEPDEQEAFLQARNSVDHDVSGVTFVESFGSNEEAAQATKAVGVMDAQGAYWWNGKQADLKYIWQAHEKASRALLEQQSQTPEDLMLQRLPDKSRKPLRDPTAIS